MAERIAETLIGEFSVPWVKVCVNKPGAIRGARDVGIIIERTAGRLRSLAHVYLSLGSNVSPVDNLRLAIRELGKRYGD